MVSKPSRQTNWFAVAAVICIPVLLVLSYLGLMGIITIGTGWGIFTLAVGFNGVICAVLSARVDRR